MSNKLLLADDSITIRKVVGIIFANEDYILTVVDNGKAALERAREIIPDLIMADVLMPGNTGYEVCAEVRRDPALKHIPLLLLTGAFEPFDEQKARQSGADDFISKPFESQQLIDKVKGLIEMGKERKMSVPAPELAAVAAPLPLPDQLTVPPPEAPALGEMGGVFPQLEEIAEEPLLQLDQLSDLNEVADKPSLQTDQLSAPVEIAEASPEDDLWDVFSLEEEAECEAADAGTGDTVLEEEAEELFTEDETIGEYAFSEEEDTTLRDAGPLTTGAPPMVAADMFDHIGEELSITEEKLQVAEPDSGGVFELTDEPEEMETIVSAADEAPTADTSVVPEFDLQFASEEEYVPISPPVLPIVPPESPAVSVTPAMPVTPAESVTPAAPVATSPAIQGVPPLSEEQLAALVATISRDIIEKIVWEVVPDLAETLIKEEIRKLKEGLRR